MKKRKNTRLAAACVMVALLVVGLLIPMTAGAYTQEDAAAASSLVEESEESSVASLPSETTEVSSLIEVVTEPEADGAYTDGGPVTPAIEPETQPDMYWPAAPVLEQLPVFSPANAPEIVYTASTADELKYGLSVSQFYNVIELTADIELDVELYIYSDMVIRSADADNPATITTTSSGNPFFHVSGQDAKGVSILFENLVFDGMQGYIRINGTNSFTMKNCEVKNLYSERGSFFDFPSTTILEDFSLVDCTFDTVSSTILNLQSANTGFTVSVTGCEFVNCEAEDYLISVSSATSGTSSRNIVLDNCVFTSNTMTSKLDRDAVVVISGLANAQITNCTFTGNHTDSTGMTYGQIGLLYMRGPASIDNCTFEDNTAEYNSSANSMFYAVGVGVETSEDDFSISNSRFISNTLNSSRGNIGSVGMYVAYVNNATIENCEFTGNSIQSTSLSSSSVSAAGMYLSVQSSAEVIGCTFKENTNTSSSKSDGAALRLAGGNISIKNSVFTDNTSRTGGAAIYIPSTKSTDDVFIQNVTFKNNTAVSGSMEVGAGDISYPSLMAHHNALVEDCVSTTNDVDYATNNNDINITTYNAVYWPNGAAGATVRDTLYFYENNTQYPIKNPSQVEHSRFGYDFKGWAITAAGGVVYQPGDIVAGLTSTLGLYGVWEANGEGYTVKYSANGGIGGATVTVTPETSHAIYTAAEAEVNRAGHTLSGWATSAGGEVVYTPGQDITPTSDMDLFAIWQHDGSYYDIVYEANGGTGGTTAKVIPTYTHQIHTAAQAGVERFAYTLEGWSTSPAGPVEYSPGQTITPAGNMKLYAQWQHDGTFYSIVYNPNGSQGGSTEKVIPGQQHAIASAAQAKVSRAGHILSGWATSAGGEVVYTPGQDITPTSDMDLFAIWQHDGSYYDIVYDANGGTGSTTAKVIPTYTHQIHTAAHAGVERYAYTLEGWSTSPSGPIEYYPGQTITPSSDMRLYAQWEHDGTVYSVAYKAGTYGSGGASLNVIPGDSHTVYTAAAANVTRYGHILQGWDTTYPGNDVVYPIGSSFTPTGHVMLHAVWQHDGSTYYAVTYNPNGGVGGTTAKVIPGDAHTIYTAAEAKVTRYGYRLAGWIPSDGAVLLQPGVSFTRMIDTTLDAQWEHDGETYYTITYNANGGNGGTSAKVIPEESHTAYTADTAGVTKYGHKLEGWATSPTGTALYPAGSSFVPTKDTTLYAVWKHDNQTFFSITYDAGDGKGGSVAKVIPGETHSVYSAEAAEVALCGYVLVGWSTRPGGEIEYTVGKQLLPISDQVLYAVWAHDGEQVTISYNAVDGEGGIAMDILRDAEHEIYSAHDAQVAYYGHGLVGWALEAGGGIAYVPGDKVYPAKDLKLYALWEAYYSALPTIDAVEAGARELEGNGAPSSEIVITWPDGSTSETIVEEDGRWKADVPEGIELKPDEQVTATQREQDKLDSEPVETIVQKAPVHETPVPDDGQDSSAPVAQAGTEAAAQSSAVAAGNIPQTGDVGNSAVMLALAAFCALLLFSVFLITRIKKDE